MVISIAHDFSCPWCWVGLHQAKRLAEELGAEFAWRAYEIFPEDMPFEEYHIRNEPPDKPPTPTRMQLAYAAEGMERPTNRGPLNIRTHKAHEAVEYKKTEGRPDALVEAIYVAYYEQAADIDDLDTLLSIARPHVENPDELRKSVAERRFAKNIVPFDEPAYETGVYNVPTFFIAEDRYAEQPYVVLRKAMQQLAVRA